MFSITQVVVDQDEARYLEQLRKLVISSDNLKEPRYDHAAMVRMANVIFQNVRLSRSFIAVCRFDSELSTELFQVIGKTFVRTHGVNTPVEVQSLSYYQRSQDRIGMSFGDPDSDI
jgi:hypothetical protein